MSSMLRSNVSLSCFSDSMSKLTKPTPKARSTKLRAVCSFLIPTLRHAMYSQFNFMLTGAER